MVPVANFLNSWSWTYPDTLPDPATKSKLPVCYSKALYGAYSHYLKEVPIDKECDHCGNKILEMNETFERTGIRVGCIGKKMPLTDESKTKCYAFFCFWNGPVPQINPSGGEKEKATKARGCGAYLCFLCRVTTERNKNDRIGTPWHIRRMDDPTTEETGAKWFEERDLLQPLPGIGSKSSQTSQESLPVCHNAPVQLSMDSPHSKHLRVKLDWENNKEDQYCSAINCRKSIIQKSWNYLGSGNIADVDTTRTNPMGSIFTEYMGDIAHCQTCGGRFCYPCFQAVQEAVLDDKDGEEMKGLAHYSKELAQRLGEMRKNDAVETKRRRGESSEPKSGPSSESGGLDAHDVKRQR